MLLQRSGQQWLAHAPAKLNVFLEIIGKRQDGYHDLETCMVSVDLYDTLRFRPHSDGLTLHVRCERGCSRIPTDGSNLVLRAAALLQQRTGITSGAEIRLTKRIPAQSGLGGGSSDAAATLLCLNDMWQAGLDLQELHTLAAELGSDVNFSLSGFAAGLCRGRGELVEPVRSPRMSFVVACPQFGLSTAAVFRECTVPTVPRSLEAFGQALQSGVSSPLIGQMHNRLQQPARSLTEGLSQLEDAFTRLPVIHHQMTGSGSAWFGLCAGDRVARRSARLIRLRGVAPVAFAVSARAESASPSGRRRTAASATA